MLKRFPRKPFVWRTCILRRPMIHAVWCARCSLRSTIRMLVCTPAWDILIRHAGAFGTRNNCTSGVPEQWTCAHVCVRAHVLHPPSSCPARFLHPQRLLPHRLSVSSFLLKMLSTVRTVGCLPCFFLTRRVISRRPAPPCRRPKICPRVKASRRPYLPMVA